MFSTAPQRRICRWSLLVFLCLARGVAAEQEGTKVEPLSDLLEQAIFAEESMGDLDRAIGLYQDILSRSEAERSLVAQAQLRLALCHLKKGDEAAAATAFQALVENFPRHSELVAEARERLADLGHPLPDDGPSVQQIWDNDGGLMGSPSADGRYLSFTDWATGDLAIHDFKTGQNRRLTGKGSWDTPAYAEFSVISPDGSQVAYAWFIQTDVLYDLRVVATDGGEPRVLYAEEDTPWVQPVDWSPDGRRILSFLGKTDGDQLAWISLEDGAVRNLGPSRDYPDGKIALSPDGRYVVYDISTTEGSFQRDIVLIDAETGTEHVVVDHPGDDRVLGWSPEGDRLLFASDRTGDWGAWTLRVADGRVAGAPQLVKVGLGPVFPDGELFPLGFSRSGAFFYGVRGRFSDVYLGSVGAGSGSVEPDRLTQRFEGTNISPDFSPDGKHVAWISKREGEFVVVIHDLESGRDREVAVADRLRRVLSGGWGGTRWSPDGKSLLVPGMAQPQESWQGLFTIDVETGEVEQVVSALVEGPVMLPAWSPDGAIIYYRHGDAIFAFDIASQHRRVVYEGDVGNMALSRDGRTLAFTSNAWGGGRIPTLWTVPANGDEAQAVYRGPASEPFDSQTPLAWSSDGSHIIFGRGTPPGLALTDPVTELWRVPVGGGARESLGVKATNLVNLRIHPDGRRIAFEAGTRKPEIWRLDNFLPAESEER